MLKKMRWRFTGIAMIAFATVILLVSCAVNLWTYGIISAQQDETLKLLQEFDSKDLPPFASEGFHMPGPFGKFSPEMQYMTRFFTVHYDIYGNIIDVRQDYIATVSEEEAISYAENVFRKSKESGYYDDYRYLITRTDQGSTIIFLNCEREIQAMKTLLLVTLLIAAASLLAIFLLVFLLSKRAIEPFARNIETQKRFITDASHELKTPLTAISTSADILAIENGEDEWVQNIQTQSARLSKLISNLVTLSRLDEAQPFPEKTDFSLDDAIWEITEPIAAMAKAKRKNYMQKIEDGIVIHGDRAAIQQMVSILLDNAVKYSDEGGSIRLEVKKKQRKAQIVVCNTCTIDPKQIDRLFDRFYRPDGSRSKQTGGTGIGLSIAKATAEAHGGKIAVSSESGKDITFTVTI